MKNCGQKAFVLGNFIDRKPKIIKEEKKQILRQLQMVTMEHSFVMATYNSQGHGVGRIEYIKRLLKKCDVLLWQNIGIAEKNWII